MLKSILGLLTKMENISAALLYIDERQPKYRLIALVLFILLVILIGPWNVLLLSNFSLYRLRKITDPVPFPRLSPPSLLHLNQTIKHIAAIQQTYLINLPRRQDRRTTSIALLQTLHLDAHIVPALDIHAPQVLSRIHLVHTGKITLLELACWASHMQIWTEIAATASPQNDTWSLIFEDDIDLEMMTVNILQSFPDDLWSQPDMIYLGHCGNPPGTLLYRGLLDYRVHRALNPSCTHAYALRSSAAARLVRLLSTPLRAVDDDIAVLGKEGKLLIFSIHPPLARQQSITSSHQSDVNPQKNTWVYGIKTRIDFFVEWWQGVEYWPASKDSALARANLSRADDWRKMHEGALWSVDNPNISVTLIS